MCIAGCGPGLQFASDPTLGLILLIVGVIIALAAALFFRFVPAILLGLVVIAAGVVEYIGLLPPL